MIISASTDYREAARRKLPPFLFHYIDGDAYAEHTLKRNVSDLSDIALRQRILVVLMKGHQRGGNAEVGEQLPAAARVLRADGRHRTQHLQCAWGQVAQVADRGGDDEQGSGRHSSGVRWLGVES